MKAECPDAAVSYFVCSNISDTRLEVLPPGFGMLDSTLNAERWISDLEEFKRDPFGAPGTVFYRWAMNTPRCPCCDRLTSCVCRSHQRAQSLLFPDPDQFEHPPRPWQDKWGGEVPIYADTGEPVIWEEPKTDPMDKFEFDLWECATKAYTIGFQWYAVVSPPPPPKVSPPPTSVVPPPLL